MAKLKLEDGTEIEAFTADEVQARIENELAGLKAKRDELLGLHAKDKERLTELEEAQRLAEEERQKEKGEFKQLYEKTQAELQAEREAARKEREERQKSDITSASTSIAAAIGVDENSAKLLAKEVREFAKYSPEGVKYEIGGVEVDKQAVIDHLSKEYPRLVKGNSANGGGAQGSFRNGQAAKTWEQLSGMERVELRRNNPAEHARLKAAAGQ